MKSFLIKFVFFIIWGACLLGFWSWYWGFWGRIGPHEFNRIVKSLPPWQKQELADALNYYYNNDIITRNTKGYLLRCDPTVKSMSAQFNWFHRNTVSAMFNRMPGYHEVVRDALCSQTEWDETPLHASTFELELLLEELIKREGKSFMTNKDAFGLGMSLGSLALDIFGTAINPFVGLGITAINLTQSSLSDPAKAIPGILCFLNIRRRDLAYTFLLSWGASFLVLKITGKLFFGGKKSKSSKKSRKTTPKKKSHKKKSKGRK